MKAPVARAARSASRRDAQCVVLGPSFDLHTGVHGALQAHPPPGVRYEVRGARHVFLVPSSRRSPWSPTRHRHLAELVDFGEGEALVHSARWPVLGRRAWVADMDELSYPMLTGRHALEPRFRRAFAKPWSCALERDLRLRAGHMLLAWAHPSCRALLFRTERGLAEAAALLQALGVGALADTVLAKSRVIYPAVPAADRAQVRHKWATAAELRVVFCGRDFEGKDGALALRVLAALVIAHPAVRPTFIGEIPEPWRRRHAALIARVEHVPVLPRTEVLERFRDAHVLFHPAPRESVGMVLLEAASAGMAIVASAGPGTSQLPEIASAAGTATVRRDRGTAEEHEAGFLSALTALVADPARARAMALANHAQAATGATSLGRRDCLLAEIYDTARRTPASEPLTLDDVRFHGRPRVVEMTTEVVRRDEVEFAARIGMTGRNVYF